MLENILDVSWTITPQLEKSRNKVVDYTESDIDNFAEITFRQVAEDLGVKFKDIKDVLYGRNIEFFEEKARFFAEYDSVESTDSDFKSLMTKLKIPNTAIYANLSAAGKFLKNFNDLTEIQKVEVLDTLSSMRVDIPTDSPSSIGTEDFLGRFSCLSPTQKYEVIKSFSKVYVTKNGER